MSRKGAVTLEKLAIFMADGCEEIEGLTVVDLLRRAGIAIDMVSIQAGTKVRGSHAIVFEADTTAEKADFSSYTGVILSLLGGPFFLWLILHRRWNMRT